MRWTTRAVVLVAVAGAVALSGMGTPLAAALGGSSSGQDARIVLPSGRAYVLHTPPQLRTAAAAEGRPAMIVMHGLHDSAGGIAEGTGFNRLADRDGDLVAYPEGIRSSFNAGLCCGSASDLRVDDVAFLVDVAADLRRRGAHRIAVAGFSNGGMMAYRFACERPDLVAAVGVVSATLEVPHCKGPIRALHLHGAADPVVPYEGKVYSPLLHNFLRDVRTIQGAAPGSEITIRVLPGGHHWPDSATQEIWSFAGMGRP